MESIGPARRPRKAFKNGQNVKKWGDIGRLEKKSPAPAYKGNPARCGNQEWLCLYEPDFWHHSMIITDGRSFREVWDYGQPMGKCFVSVIWEQIFEPIWIPFSSKLKQCRNRIRRREKKIEGRFKRRCENHVKSLAEEPKIKITINSKEDQTKISLESENKDKEGRDFVK